MSVVVVQQDDSSGPFERCCFCRRPTGFWYEPNDVACCPECAEVAQPKDVPTKSVWWRREVIAMCGARSRVACAHPWHLEDSMLPCCPGCGSG